MAIIHYLEKEYIAIEPLIAMLKLLLNERPRTGPQSMKKCLTDVEFDNIAQLIAKNPTGKQLRCAYCPKESLLQFVLNAKGHSVFCALILITSCDQKLKSKRTGNLQSIRLASYSI